MSFLNLSLRNLYFNQQIGLATFVNGVKIKNAKKKVAQTDKQTNIAT